jgi:hypothetical protein
MERRKNRGAAALAALVLLGSAPLALQDAEEDPRRVIPAKTMVGADTIGHKEVQTGFTLEDAILQASNRTAMLFYDKKGLHTGTAFRNVLVHVAPGTLELDRSYWGIRGYDMVDTLFERVEITGFGRVTPRHDEGHAIYLNLAGDLTLEDCFIHHNGGQGLQLVNRPGESTQPRGPAPGTITIERTRFHENGFNPDRGGFQVSIFGTGQDIVLRDVEIVAGQDATGWPRGRTSGGLVIEAEPWIEGKKDPWWRPEDPPADFPEGFEVPFTQGRVELERVTVHHRNPSKSLVQIKGCEELVVRGCTFQADPGGAPGKIALDHPQKPGRDSGRIVWEGNSGNAIVILRGKEVGPASMDFVVEPETDSGGR